MTIALAEHLQRLASSFMRWTGRELIPVQGSGNEFAKRLFEAPLVVLSHGTETDPILNYGNRMALALWEADWDRFIGTPSRITAEPQAREERARALATVASRGFTDNYQGIRVSLTGRRFRIERAVVWTIVDNNGRSHGQAATFDQWAYLE